ncbi:hypothetical protein [Streptomyces lydicus]|uniref:hypothetical protein n=1 Tax=Streptomyces lydicus TaxID=47763 RepID=UPI0037A3388A
MNLSRLIRNASAAAVAAGLLTTGVVALAAPASAVGSSGCSSRYVNNNGSLLDSVATLTRSGAVNLRTGPGTGYTSKGNLYQASFWATCSAKNYSWVYGKVTSGAHKGQWGWVARQNTGLTS